MIQKSRLNFGEIWLANLNPGSGAEPGKTRPVLIIQDQALLDISHPSTLIIPLTTDLFENALPLRIRIESQDNLKKDSDLLIDQIRAIDNQRFKLGPLMTCSNAMMQYVQKAILEVMGVKIEDFA
jgi:mRNA interferase MazF